MDPACARTGLQGPCNRGQDDQALYRRSYLIDQSLEAAARLVVADRLISPFELSRQSKLIIGQLRAVTFCPSMKPASHSALRKAASERAMPSGVPEFMNPTTGVADCCARAAVPAWQEITSRAAQRSLAVLSPAC